VDGWIVANKATYEAIEFRASFINDVLVGLDVGRPSPDSLVDSVDVFSSRTGHILKLDGLARLPGA